MLVRDVLEKDIPVVVEMLNEHLSFGLSTEEYTRSQIADTQIIYKCVEVAGEIVAVMRANKFETFDEEKMLELGYYASANEFFKANGVCEDFYTVDLVVVIPKERGKGYMKTLLKECVPQNKPVVSVLWLRKGETVNLSKFSKTLKIERYWDGLEYPCPDCEGYCECNAVAVIK